MNALTWNFSLKEEPILKKSNLDAVTLMFPCHGCSHFRAEFSAASLKLEADLRAGRGIDPAKPVRTVT